MAAEALPGVCWVFVGFHEVDRKAWKLFLTVEWEKASEVPRIPLEFWRWHCCKLLCWTIPVPRCLFCCHTMPESWCTSIETVRSCFDVRSGKSWLLDACRSVCPSPLAVEEALCYNVFFSDGQARVHDDSAICFGFWRHETSSSPVALQGLHGQSFRQRTSWRSRRSRGPGHLRSSLYVDVPRLAKLSLPKMYGRKFGELRGSRALSE